MILYYVKKKEQKKLFQAAFGRMKLTSRELIPSDLKKTVGETLGMPASLLKGKTQPSLPPMVQMKEMILISGTGGKDLDSLLMELGRIDPERKILRAVVTPHNISWTLYQLQQELGREHEQLHR